LKILSDHETPRPASFFSRQLVTVFFFHHPLSLRLFFLQLASTKRVLFSRVAFFLREPSSLRSRLIKASSLLRLPLVYACRAVTIFFFVTRCCIPLSWFLDFF